MPRHLSGRIPIRSLFFLCLICVGGASQAIAASHVVIGEVNWAGSSQSIADEWVELWNLEETPLSLDGYCLHGASDEAHPICFGEGDVIAPHEAYLVANYPEDYEKSALNHHPNVVTSAVSISNRELRMKLIDNAGVTVDEIEALDGPPAGSNGEPIASMIRAIDAMTEEPIWVTASSSRNLDGGIADLGTPGFCDARGERLSIESTTGSGSFSDASSSDPFVTITTSTLAWISPTGTAVDRTVTSSTIDGYASSTESIARSVTSTQDLFWFAHASSSVTTSTIEVLGSYAHATSTDTDPSILSTSSTDEEHRISDAATTKPFDSSSVTSTDEYVFPDTTSTASTSTTSTEETLQNDKKDEQTSAVYASLPVLTPVEPIVYLIEPLINEVNANPVDGQEWIEFSNVVDPQHLVGWWIEDEKSVIYRFTQEAVAQMIVRSDEILVVTLSGSHLNNGGDRVLIRSADGGLIDETTFPAIGKGETWSRDITDHRWKKSTRPTPWSPNAFEEEVNASPSDTTVIPASTAANTQPASQTVNASSASSTVHKKQPTSSPTTSVKTIRSTPWPETSAGKAAAKTESQQKKTTKKTTNKAAKATQKTTTKRPSTPSSTAMNNTLRVRLSGTVATVPGILAKNQFVLLAEDGRGLLVKGNGRQVSPPYQERISVVGSLTTNDDGTWLSMSAGDRWTMDAPSTHIPELRQVDLLSPTAEDFWSLISVTGTVLQTSKTRMTLDLDDVELVVSVKQVVGYRTQRLQKGDIVRVRGLFSMSGGEPTIHPITAEDIELIEHPVETVTSPSPAPAIPSWTPLGAAGITVAVTEGIKRIRTIQRHRKLATQLASAAKRADLSCVE